MDDWFKDCNTLEEGKKQYRSLLMTHHPDKDPAGTEVTKRINLAWEDFIRVAVSNIHKAHGQEFFKKKSEWYYNALKAVLDLNVRVEVIGDWIWAFDTAPMDIIPLTLMGFTHSTKHNGWFWYDTSEQVWNNRIGPRRDFSTNDLRDLWGHETKQKKRYI